MILSISNSTLFGSKTTPFNTVGQVTSLVSLVGSASFGYLYTDKNKPSTVICTLGFVSISTIALISSTSLKSTTQEKENLQRDYNAHLKKFEEMEQNLAKTEQQLETATTNLETAQKKQKFSLEQFEKTIDDLINNNILDGKLTQELKAHLESLQKILKIQKKVKEQTTNMSEAATQVKEEQQKMQTLTKTLIEERKRQEKRRTEAEALIKNIRKYKQELSTIQANINEICLTLTDQTLKEKLNDIQLQILNFADHLTQDKTADKST